MQTSGAANTLAVFSRSLAGCHCSRNAQIRIPKSKMIIPLPRGLPIGQAGRGSFLLLSRISVICVIRGLIFFFFSPLVTSVPFVAVVFGLLELFSLCFLCDSAASSFGQCNLCNSWTDLLFLLALCDLCALCGGCFQFVRIVLSLLPLRLCGKFLWSV